MKDIILKWWNRKWSNWEHFGFVSVYSQNSELAYEREEILISHSNDGLTRYKKIKVW